MTTDLARPSRRAPFPRKSLLRSAWQDGQRVTTPLPDGPAVAPGVADVAMRVNGDQRQVQVPVNETLVETLRERIGLTGTKVGCDDGSCGTCTVSLGGRPVYACMVLTLDCNAQDVLTIEGVGTEDNPHPLQVTYADRYAAQCGFCTPGMIIAAKALLDSNPNPSEADVRLGLSGVICRCGYRKIIEATLEAAALVRGGGT